MRREGFFDWVFGKILDRGMSAKCLVRPEGEVDAAALAFGLE